jgi:hypothetical protein
MSRLTGLLGVAALVFTVACGRTDAGITASVQSRLAVDDMVRAADVDVTNEDGVVTLRGQVDSFAEKQQALMIARETDGVRNVIDELEVMQTAPTTGFMPRDDVDALGDPRRDDLEQQDDLNRAEPVEPRPAR